ncbi:MAG: MBL fold metallo-hydrolase [Oscillospiraceae bacterium]|nr:MBL fold metallo-hydrolase [Oscillospiraceae bacterium]
MKVIWHGTAAIETACSGGRILFDPFVPLRGADTQMPPETFDGFSDIFVTHGHFDHIMSLPAIAARNPDVRIHCTKTPYETLRKKGVPENSLRLLSFGQTVSANGFLLHVLRGKHAVLPSASPARLWYALRSPYRGNLPRILRENRLCRENDETVFYQLEADGRTVSLMGSLNLREEADYPVRSDLLVLPYNGWEDNYPPAVRVIERLQPKRVVLDHWDDAFPPLTMPVDLSPILARYPDRISPMTPGRAEEL